MDPVLCWTRIVALCAAGRIDEAAEAAEDLAACQVAVPAVLPHALKNRNHLRGFAVILCAVADDLEPKRT